MIISDTHRTCFEPTPSNMEPKSLQQILLTSNTAFSEDSRKIILQHEMCALIDHPDSRKHDSSSMEWLLSTMEKATGRYWVWEANDLIFYDFDEEQESDLYDLLAESDDLRGDMCFGDATEKKIEEGGWDLP